MSKIQNYFMLSDEGYKDLKKAILACTLSNFSLMIPFSITIGIIMEVIKPLMNQDVDWNKLLLFFIGGCIALFIIFLFNKNDYKKTYVTSYMESKKARVSIAEHIRKLPMSVFKSKDITELSTNIMGDVATNEHVLSHVIPQVIANFISITIICIMLSIFDWRMSLAIFITVPISFGIIYIGRRIYEKLHKKHAQAKLKASAEVQEYIEGIKVIVACNMSGAKFKKLEQALIDMKSLAVKMEIGTGVFVTGAQVVLQSGIGICILVGTILLSNGQLNLITFIVFALIVVRVYGPLLTELTLLPEFLYHQISLQRIRDIMSIQPMVGKEDVKITNMEIKFNDVSFAYEKSKDDVLKDINVVIPEKSVTALVGPSGSGKSTMSYLIARFWDVNKGMISIDGINVKDIDPETLMSYMSFVFQDVILFNDTIYNNIKIGNVNATDEEIMKAAKMACCDDFINKLPDGYNTILGENGSTLSGGERQRLSIARAFLKDAPIVLLDEATASLDPENEEFVQEAITRLIKDKTVIVIAHKLKTIKNVDKIIVLENGEMIEEGTHTTLLDNNKLYKKLFDAQKESEEWAMIN